MFFPQTKIQQITVQEHLFNEFALAHPTFGLCTSQNYTFTFTYHPFNDHTMCTIDDLQHLIFGNSQPSDKISGKTKIVSHLNISQESLKQKINVDIYIAHNLQGQWHILISTQTAKIPFLDSYSFPVTCTTHIRPSFITTNHPLITLQ